MSDGSLARLRQLVKKIPRGRIITYGELAAAAGMPGAARAAGRALSLMGPEVPWQRVLGKKDARRAHITNRKHEQEQRRLLAREGVAFDASGGVSLARFGWSPLRSARLKAQPKAPARPGSARKASGRSR